MKFPESVKRINKKYIIFAFVMLAVYSFFLLHIAQAVTAGAAEPGTDANPLVSQDYVDSKIKTLETKITTLTNKLNQAISQNSELAKELAGLVEKTETLEKQLQQPVASSGFEIVQVKAGKRVICGINTEFIIRGGTSTTIAGSSGGIADLTAGKDLQQGNVIPMNHLILVPKDDGRGFKVVTDTWVLIKGQYTIE